MSQSLRDELRAATQLHHNAIENTIDLMRPDITMADYIGYLCKFYGYYSVLESRLIAGDLSYCNSALKLERRRKVERLESDIDTLCGSKSLEKIPLCQFSPTIGNATDVVGCSYVVEGSTLGALIIYQHLHKCLGVTANNGASFIHGYGESTGAQWKRFVEAIEAMTFDPRQRKACIEAAITTFETMGNWFSKQAYEPPRFSERLFGLS